MKKLNVTPGGRDIDPEIERKYTAEKDLWVNCGEKGREFAIAGFVIGALISKFDSAEQRFNRMDNSGSWINVKAKTREDDPPPEYNTQCDRSLGRVVA